MTTKRPGFIPRIFTLAAAMMGGGNLVYMRAWQQADPATGPQEHHMVSAAAELELLFRLLSMPHGKCKTR